MTNKLRTKLIIACIVLFVILILSLTLSLILGYRVVEAKQADVSVTYAPEKTESSQLITIQGSSGNKNTDQKKWLGNVKTGDSETKMGIIMIFVVCMASGIVIVLKIRNRKSCD